MPVFQLRSSHLNGAGVDKSDDGGGEELPDDDEDEEHGEGGFDRVPVVHDLVRQIAFFVRQIPPVTRQSRRPAIRRMIDR